jgi:hypothetical protein
MILEGTVPDGSAVRVTVRDGKLAIEPVRSEAEAA